jgi:hypothetical protein
MEGILFIAVVLLAGWFVTGPLRGGRQPVAENAQLAALRAARDAKLRELRDAELDFATGKLTRQDYELLNSTLRAEAAALLRQLDTTKEATA